MAALQRRRAALRRKQLQPTFDASLDQDERSIVEACRPYTMTSTERLAANIDAVRHVVGSNVPGALVECGVWRGGSMLAMVMTLQRLGVDDRDLFLFDTFEGMTRPTDSDTSRFDEPAVVTFRRARAAGQRVWDPWFKPELVGAPQVRSVLTDTGYPADRIHLVAGDVEKTLPAAAPAEIAVLRLDTDWYESTRHELEHLYPLLQPGGVLLIDDYGHWDGARRAVEEYFDAHAPRPLLARTDYSGRLAVKPR